MYKRITNLEYTINLSGGLWTAECVSLSLSGVDKFVTEALRRLDKKVTNLILEAPYLPERHFFSEEILHDRFCDHFRGEKTYSLLGQALQVQKTEAFKAKVYELRPEWQRLFTLPIPDINCEDELLEWDKAEHLAKLDFSRFGVESEMWRLWIKLALWWNKAPTKFTGFGKYSHLTATTRTLADRIKDLGILSPWKESDILLLTEDEALAIRDSICSMGSEKDNISFDVTWEIGSAVEDFMKERML